MKKSTLSGNLMLILTAFIWGTAFVAQRQGVELIDPITFNAVRNYIAAIFLFPVMFFLKKINIKTENINGTKKDLIIGGISCGIMLFLASTFQQIGIKYTAAGKAGFITTFYVIIVPVLGLLAGRKIGLKIWISLILAIFGLYLLCMGNGFEGISKGDIYILACAFCYAFHIIVIDYFSPKTDNVKMSCIQFFVVAVLSSIFMFIFENPVLSNIIKTAGPILYTGILSSGVAYTLQIIGQKRTEPVIASLLMSLESVFSVLAGWVILKEVLSLRELSGCLVVFIAVILSQLPDKVNLKK